VHARALRDRLARDLDVAREHAREPVHGGSKRSISSTAVGAARVGDEPPARVAIAVEQQQRVAERARRGLGARHEQQEAQPEQLVLGERVALGRRVSSTLISRRAARGAARRTRARDSR
jgi:hypothetical protein